MNGAIVLIAAACQLVEAGSLRRDDTIQQNIINKLALTEDIDAELSEQLILHSAKSGCPEPFMYVSMVNGCYAVVNDNLEWDIAVIRCRSLRKDAHIVVIDNAQEQAAVAGVLAWHTSMGLVSKVTSGLFWTAAQRVDRTRLSTFVWRTSPEVCNVVKSVKEMKYSHWCTGEPNNFPEPSRLESCACIHRACNYGWADISCSAAIGTVCEIDI